MKLWLCLIFISLNFWMLSQSGINFEKYDIRDGLSQTIVNCVEQDQKGYLWIGTQDGLNKFDGYKFTVFKPDPFDENSIADNYINHVKADKNNHIWIASEAGLSVYHDATRSFIQFDKSKTFKDEAINHLMEDKDGTMWVSTRSKGLYKIKELNDSSQTAIDTIKPLIERNILQCIRYGKQIIILSHDALFTMENNTLSQIHFPNEAKNLVIHSLRILENELWLATNQGAFKAIIVNSHLRLISKIDTKAGLKSNEISSLYRHNNFFWIGTSYGLSRVIILQNDTIIENIASELISNYDAQPAKVSSFLLDDFGSLWIGTDRGLNKFDENKSQFKLYRHQKEKGNSHLYNNIWSFETIGNYILTGSSKGLSVCNRGNNTFTNYSSENSLIPKGNLSNIFKDSKDRLWIGGNNEGIKLFSFNEGDLKYLRFLNLDFDNGYNTSTYSILEDNEGQFWIGGKSGLWLLDKNLNLKEHFVAGPDSFSLSFNVVRCVYQDSKGNIWVGTDGGGLNRVFKKNDGAYAFEIFSYNAANRQGLNHNMVLSITEDKDGNIWCATYGGGLNKYVPEEKRFYHLTEKQGLSNNVVYGVVLDEYGNIWASTNKGLSQINTDDNSVRIFTEKSGLQSDEFNIGAYHIDEYGDVFFGGINGFNSFNPANIRSNTLVPKINITGISILDENLDLNKYVKSGLYETEKYELKLNHHQNNLSFDFVGLHYSSPKDNWYKYILEGLQEDWVIGKNRKFATFNNLDAGEYTFKVAVANSDRVWGKEFAEVKITILPPIWDTWWFRIVASIILLGLILGIYFSRLAMVKAQKRLLEQQVSVRTQKVLEQKKKIEIQKELIEKEKHKAEKLLLNILPQETADELITKGKASPRHYRMATVMFCDFKGFTKIAERLEPQELVDELDRCFNAFDDIMEKYNVEKIKTSGDAYMAAGGVPIRNKTNPIDMVLAAMEVQEFMAQHKKERLAEGRLAWELRIGIHTGEVIAGVVGKKKFAYDIWGDTVNTAARMESSSETTKINISGSTFRYVNKYFQLDYRGKIAAKNKGEIDMYFVSGIKKELSVKDEGRRPNVKFKELLDFNIFSKLNYNRVRKHLINRLEKDLPRNLHYHGVHHTRDVIRSAERIAISEGMDDESVMLIKTAALFHDAGFLRKYWKNEPQGVELARELLPQYDYTDAQMDIIEDMILATAVPQNPKNIYQEILCDADLDYLGRDDFDEISDTLCQELIEYGKIKNPNEWDAVQVKFLKKHKYFTQTSKETRTAKKLAQLEEIKRRLKA
jgi:ligand-binding sensor domain-containing protein/class 3 adenylate cyclase/predicted metal-dependent HD superfamily phosphohydrolase